MISNMIKKLKSENGVTGQDLVIALFILAMSLTFLLTVYSNIRSLSYEMRMNARAHDVATKIAEQLDSLEYDDDFFYKTRSNINEEVAENFGITDLNPDIYKINISVNKLKYDEFKADFDIVKEIVIQVKYDLKGDFENADATEIRLTKQRENVKLEDDIYMYDYLKPVVISKDGKEYVNTLNNINLSGIDKKFKVVSKSDENWANYSYFDSFLCYATTLDAKEVDAENVQAWIPRFAITPKGKLAFLYKETNYPIVPVYATREDGSKFVSGYTVDRTKEFDTKYFEDGQTGKWESIGNSDLYKLLVDHLNDNNIYTEEE